MSSSKFSCSPSSSTSSRGFWVIPGDVQDGLVGPSGAVDLAS